MERIQDIVTEMGYQVQKKNGTVSIELLEFRCMLLVIYNEHQKIKSSFISLHMEKISTSLMKRRILWQLLLRYFVSTLQIKVLQEHKGQKYPGSLSVAAEVCSAKEF